MQVQGALKTSDFAEVVQDAEFIEWVKDGKLRMNNYAEAS
jgi:hypothetical protein